jgi:hypothetical protein
MDFQTLFNLGGGAILTVIGWFCREIWDNQKKFKEDLDAFKLYVSEKYPKKDELKERFDRIDLLLDKVYEKLEQKVDR